MRTSNPALNDQAFRGAGVAIGEPMTLQGTVNKTGVLLLCVIATAAWTWNIFMHSHSQESAMSLAMVGGIGGFIFALVTIFKKTWAPVTAPIYALARRPGARRNFRHVRAAFSGHCDSSRQFDVWHAGRAAAGLPFGT